MMGHFPDCCPLIRRWMPIFRQFLRAKQPNVSRFRMNDTWVEAGHRSDFGFAQQLGIAEISVVKSVLFEPRNSPTRLSIELVFLLGKNLCQRLIDECERGTDLHGFSATLQNAA